MICPVDSIQASESSPPPGARSKRRLSRTLSRARWPEYGRLLKTALGTGYRVATLESFLDGTVDAGEAPILILRHDVDQLPASALTMSDAEVALGLRSTWYFRWRTADRAVIEELRRRGGEVGLHYETLSRESLAGRTADSANEEVLDEAREILRAEIASFAKQFGPIRSVAAHGDTRTPEIRNAVLLRDQVWSEFGVDYDANDAMRRHRLAAWVTDRSVSEGGWSEGVDPFDLVRRGESPILCLTHPNNWVSGLSLWRDRLATARKRGVDEPISSDDADGRQSTSTG
jgi:hypothetical protein